MPIPDSLLVDLEAIPRDRPVTLLMRHSERFPITDPARNYEVGLTEEGVRMAADLGNLLGARFSPGRLHTSPVGRCVDTANAIARGAGWPIQAQPHPSLSHEHIEPAWDRLAAGQVNGRIPPEVTATLALLLDSSLECPVLELFVTHDTVLGALVGCLLRQPVMQASWPGFLEGAFFWRDGSNIQSRWRGVTYPLPPAAGEPPLQSSFYRTLE